MEQVERLDSLVRDDLIFQYQFESEFERDEELMNALVRVIKHYSNEEEFETFMKEVV